MAYRKALVVCFLCLFCWSAYCQNKCARKVDLVSVKETSNSTMKVELRVEGSGRFEGELIAVGTAGDEAKKTFSGFGSESVMLEDLNRNLQYKVVVSFPEEQKFLCKTKVIPDISLQRD